MPAGIVAVLLVYPVGQSLWLLFVRPVEPLVIDSTAAVSLPEFLVSRPAIPYCAALYTAQPKKAPRAQSVETCPIQRVYATNPPATTSVSPGVYERSTTLLS